MVERCLTASPDTDASTGCRIEKEGAVFHALGSATPEQRTDHDVDGTNLPVPRRSGRRTSLSQRELAETAHAPVPVASGLIPIHAIR